ncbi:uncharacterized protein EI97DRAFT_433125 [Westerdykella ornata]|uniref:Uncharacterized protein n=1 Tax=Westerdykella ornata TaxID=318751 RepID=A0A6A6JJT7_WESOR|nr:uncharacterized protein EI97DRAFT_433125 [Westerdykella ornata]KAF2276910.1 hypothetical protein EI97DRAFT_433125 [Westerdykella ornata]
MLEPAATLDRHKFSPVATSVGSATMDAQCSTLVANLEDYIQWLPEECINDAQFSALDTAFEYFRTRMLGTVQDAVKACFELRQGKTARFSPSLYPDLGSLHGGIQATEYQVNLALIIAMKERAKTWLKGDVAAYQRAFKHELNVLGVCAEVQFFRRITHWWSDTQFAAWWRGFQSE